MMVISTKYLFLEAFSPLKRLGGKHFFHNFIAFVLCLKLLIFL